MNILVQFFMKNCLILRLLYLILIQLKRAKIWIRNYSKLLFKLTKLTMTGWKEKILIVSKNTADLISYLHILCVPSSMIVVTVETWKMKLCRYCQVKKNYRFIIPYVLHNFFLTSVCERCAGQFFLQLLKIYYTFCYHSKSSKQSRATQFELNI